METLQVPTREIVVELRIGQGESLHGRMFTSETIGPTAEVDLLLELLNDERAFIPFVADQPTCGRVSLNKDHIVTVFTSPAEVKPAADPGEPDPSVSDDPCSMLLTDGQRLTGRLRVPTPWSASRVLDKLNQAPRFIPLVTPEGVSIVHGTHIVRVW